MRICRFVLGHKEAYKGMGVQGKISGSATTPTTDQNHKPLTHICTNKNLTSTSKSSMHLIIGISSMGDVP